MSFQVDKGTKYVLLLNGPYDAPDKALTAALVNVVGFGAAHVMTKAEEGVDPVALINAAKSAPGYVQSSNQKLTAVMAHWTKGTATVQSPDFRDNQDHIWMWAGVQPVKQNVKNLTWVAPLLGVAATLGVGGWLLAKLESYRS